jgi:hypothetical protein
MGKIPKDLKSIINMHREFLSEQIREQGRFKRADIRDSAKASAALNAYHHAMKNLDELYDLYKEARSLYQEK